MNVQNENEHEYEEWNTMKANWQSTSVADFMMTQQLRWGLRLRMLGSWLWLGLEAAGFLLIGLLGVIQVAMGQVAVGSLYIVLVVVCLGASLWARRASLRGASGSLAELVELSIRRARRGVRMAWANYFMTAASVVWVLVLYLSDIGAPDAAYHDGARVGGAMAIFAVYAVGVAIYHAYARRRVRRFTDMRAQLTPRGDE
jgi:hypothetical protein